MHEDLKYNAKFAVSLIFVGGAFEKSAKNLFEFSQLLESLINF